jgi:NAD(P)-dependent dehydrogenase (short-subunit alcohol dehydrogenase family)
MTNSLDGKAVLITGAAGGLGASLALECARAGCHIVLVDSDRRGIEACYDAIVSEDLPAPALHPMDLATIGPDHCDELICALDTEFGGLDALIHCAAEFEGLRPLDQVSPPVWLKTMQTNLNAAWLLSVACLPMLRKSAKGCLYFLLEDLPRLKGSFWGPYGVSKHALAAMVNQFNAEFGKTGLQILGIEPGPMRTPLRARAYHAENPNSVPEPVVSARRIVRILSGADCPAGPFVQLGVSANRNGE